MKFIGFFFSTLTVIHNFMLSTNVGFDKKFFVKGDENEIKEG
jgi:hypothetical protein